MVAPISIKEHMEVVGSDGVHVGTVDHLEGRDTVKLTKDDPDAGGEHHLIPLAWVDHVEMKVHLKHVGRRGHGAREKRPLTARRLPSVSARSRCLRLRAQFC